MRINLKNLIVVAGMLVFLTPQLSFALRCNKDLVDVGDLKHQVRLACGEPVSQETIGFIDKENNGDRIRVLKIDEWIMQTGIYFYSLEFEGNRLVKIQDAGKKP